jgi:hypothetical protein
MLIDKFGFLWIPKFLDPAHLSSVALKQYVSLTGHDIAQLTGGHRRAEGTNTFVSQAIPYKNDKYPRLAEQMSSNVTGLM